MEPSVSLCKSPCVVVQVRRLRTAPKQHRNTATQRKSESMRMRLKVVADGNDNGEK